MKTIVIIVACFCGFVVLSKENSNDTEHKENANTYCKQLLNSIDNKPNDFKDAMQKILVLYAEIMESQGQDIKYEDKYKDTVWFLTAIPKLYVPGVELGVAIWTIIVSVSV